MVTSLATDAPSYSSHYYTVPSPPPAFTTTTTTTTTPRTYLRPSVRSLSLPSDSFHAVGEEYDEYRDDYDLVQKKLDNL